MTTRPPGISSRSSSSQNERRSLWPNLLVTIPDAFSRYSGFKYRLWFIWYIWHLWSESWRSPPWSAIICGSDGNGDLWLWEDEDEEYIKVFTENIPVFPELLDWHTACWYLKERLGRTTVAARPLAHLTPQTRLRFMAWLLVAGPLRKKTTLQNKRVPSIVTMIRRWSKAIALPLTGETCDVCGVSGVLPVWIETMLEVYSRDDLRSLPWDYKCLHSQLRATADTYLGQHGVPKTPLERNSPVLHLLYELVVPFWPLLHWVVYRTGANDRAKHLAAFIDMIDGPDQDLITWDADDESELRQVLPDGLQPTLYPQDWNTYMVEISLEAWLRISRITRIDARPRSEYDLNHRIAAVILKYSSTPLACKSTIETLALRFDGFPFDPMLMARALDKHYQEPSIVANIDSKEFWASASLENWLSSRSVTFCHRVWHTPHRIGLLEGVEIIDLVLDMLPRNLATYAYSLMRLQTDRGRSLEKLGPELAASFGQDHLAALQRYSLDVHALLGLVKHSVENSSTNHPVSTYVYEHMKNDLSNVVARLVLLLRNKKSYKEFLSCRGADAQRLLDLLQDLLDLDAFSVVKPLMFHALLKLSRPSGLHPRCFALSGLQKVGKQMSGGGFGDIWKGLIGGQSVCVKSMRVFRDSNIEALLKEFGREAVIWRQMCHPNVLPFFGVYYLDNRLCLVSPWMEDGDITEFLRVRTPTNLKRLSLILDVALGLQYLHEKKIVHGDLKGLNILVTPSHRACIADFGLSSIEAMTVQLTNTTVTARGGTARYQAPELFEVENPVPNHCGSDVYAFSCVSYEILTGKVPFHELRNDMAVMTRVAQGYRPPRPDSCSSPDLNGLWELMQKCWEEDAQTRPTASQIVEWLDGPLIRAQTIPLTTDWNDEFTSKFRRSQQAEPLLPSVTQIERMLFGDAS